jgi:hypothetical protein
MGSFHAEPRVLAPGRWARFLHSQTVDGEGGQHGAVLKDLQDRPEEDAVMVSRVRGEREPLFESASAGHRCLLLEWDALRYCVMRFDAVRFPGRGRALPTFPAPARGRHPPETMVVRARHPLMRR